MERLARIVVRNSGDHKDGLLLGTVAKSGRELFKPGFVYEIVDCMGEPMIVEVGPSWVRPTATPTGLASVCCWGNSTDHLLEVAGKHLFLSEEEYLSLCKEAG